MADVQHSALTDPNIHEPKGVASAAAGKVYFADGSGSGDWLFPSGHAYSEMYITGNTTTQTLAASSGTAILNPTGAWANAITANVTATPADGEFTITSAGMYQVTFWATFDTASIAAGAKYNFHYAVNDTPSTRKIPVAKISNGVDTLHCSADGLVTLAAADTISMYVGGDATSSGTTVKILEAGFSLLLVNPA